MTAPDAVPAAPPLDLYSQVEAAAYLGVHQTRVGQLVKEGKLHVTGRTQRGWMLFVRDDLDAVELRPKGRKGE